MPDPLDALILDLLEWIGDRPRAYAEAMEAWRTSCPRLPVWEEAHERGLVERHGREGRGGTLIFLTVLGRELLDTHRPQHDRTRREDLAAERPTDQPAESSRVARRSGGRG